jgi:hypothetical protein
LRLVRRKEPPNNIHGDITRCVVRVNVECQRDDSVDTNAHGALEIVALAVLDQVVDNQHRDEEDHRLEALEVQRHGLVHDPAKNNQERSDEERDLHGGSDGHVDGEVHLALVCDDDGGDVFGGIADNGDEDKSDEGLADVCGCDDGVDAVYEVLGAYGDEHGDEDESNTSGNRRQDLGFFLLAASLLVLDIREQAVVAVELEVEVQDVEDEQNDGGAVGEDEDVLVRLEVVVLVVAVHNCVKGGGDDERGGGDGHERGHGGGDGLVEARFVLGEAGREEAAAKDLMELVMCCGYCSI